jgi:uncharacterized protein (DUF58 family)
MFLAERMTAGAGRRIRRWALRRFPRSRSVTLTQNRIFILPTRAGAGFMLLLILLLLMAVNYENNLIYAITFLAAAVFLIACLHTYGNLAGLRLQALRGNSCFAGEQAGFELELEHQNGREPEQIQLQFEQGTALMLDLEQAPQRLELFAPAPERGWLDPGGLKLDTTFPLGLFRAWSWIGLELSVLVYPRPLKGELPSLLGSGDSGEANLQHTEGTDDFTGLERFQPGMSLRQIDWKSYARGLGLQAKQFGDQQSPDIWLDLDACPGNLEQRLSRLTYWVLELSKQEQRYGLRLGAQVLKPDQGEQHRHEALKRLALFGRGGEA